MLSNWGWACGISRFGSIGLGITVGFTDSLCYLPNVERGFAFGADRVRVNLGAIFQRQAPLGVLQVLDLSQEQGVDGAIRIHRFRRRLGERE